MASSGYFDKIKQPSDYRKYYHSDPKTGEIVITKEGLPIEKALNLKDFDDISTVPPEVIWEERQTRNSSQTKGKRNSASSTLLNNGNDNPHDSPHWDLSPIKDNQKEVASDAMKMIIDLINRPGVTKVQTDYLEKKLCNILDKMYNVTNTDNDSESIESDTMTNQLKLSEEALFAKEQEIERLQAELQRQKDELTKQKSDYNHQQILVQQTIKENFDKQQKEFQEKLFQIDESRKSEAESMKSQMDILHTSLKHQQELYTNLTKTSQPDKKDLPLTPYPHDKYPPPNTSSLDASLIQELSSHMSMQNTISKQHHLTLAKSYDGTDPTQFYSWLDEIERLSTQLNMPKLEVAQHTARGPVHRYIGELKTQAKEWKDILICLRERFSDCTSTAAAQSKLSKLKQEGRGMHIYVAEFQDLLHHAHNVKSTDIGTSLLANQFIEGIDSSNKWLRNKLREKKGPHLDYYFQEALKLQASQNIRVLVFGNETQTSDCMEVQAIKSKTLTCFNCNSPEHFVKDCPEPNKMHQRQSHNNYNSHNSQNRQSHPLESTLKDLLDKMNRLLDNQRPNNYNGQNNYKPKQPHQGNKQSYQGKPNYKYDQRNNGHQKQIKPKYQRQHAHTNAIEEYESHQESDYDSDNGELVSFDPAEDQTKNL